MATKKRQESRRVAVAESWKLIRFNWRLSKRAQKLFGKARRQLSRLMFCGNGRGIRESFGVGRRQCEGAVAEGGEGIGVELRADGRKRGPFRRCEGIESDEGVGSCPLCLLLFSLFRNRTFSRSHRNRKRVGKKKKQEKGPAEGGGRGRAGKKHGESTAEFEAASTA